MNLTREQCDAIENLILDGNTVPDVKRETGLSLHIIRKYIKDTPFEEINHSNWVRKHIKLTDEMVTKVRSLIASGLTKSEVTFETGISNRHITLALRGTRLIKVASENNARKRRENYELRRSVMRRESSVPKEDYRQRRPAPLWSRFDCIRCDDGYMIIDRMSSKYSTPYEWRSGDVQLLYGATDSEAKRLVKVLNRQWHQELLNSKNDGK